MPTTRRAVNATINAPIAERAPETSRAPDERLRDRADGASKNAPGEGPVAPLPHVAAPGRVPGAATMETSSAAHIKTFLAFLRDVEQKARYPELLAPSPQSLFFRRREAEPAGSGLVINALRHADLSDDQRHALGVFRMRQSLLWEWYDPALALTWRVTSDPALLTSPDDTYHVMVGTHAGVLLSYMTMEPAADERIDTSFLPPDDDPAVADASALPGANPARRAAPRAHLRFPWLRAKRLVDTKRPLFLTERELFGPSVFTSIPQLARLPVEHVRELNVLLRNQVVSGASRVGTTAVVEAISTMVALLLANRKRISAILGHSDREAYRLLADLDIPVLYAPHTPLAYPAIGHGGPKDGLWNTNMDSPDRFWPFVIATDDLNTYASYFEWLEQRLQGTPRTILHDLLVLRHSPNEHTPSAFVARRQRRASGARSSEPVIEWTQHIAW